MKNVSVIISFYNNLKWLKLVLAGLSRQSFKDFEVVISDDGSKQEVVKAIQSLKNNYAFPISHVWHEDKGWQKNIILNKSIMASDGSYLIFIDGDCIPHRHFIKEHHNNKAKNHVLAGRRVNLPKQISEKLSEKKIAFGYLEHIGILHAFLCRLFRNGSHTENGIYIQNKWLRKKINKKDKGILGSNFSIHKSDILTVNGFDERYLKPSVGEDTDLELRLRNQGLIIKQVKHLAVQFHLFHKTLPRDNDNLKYLIENKNNKVSYTAYGIRKIS